MSTKWFIDFLMDGDEPLNLRYHFNNLPINKRPTEQIRTVIVERIPRNHDDRRSTVWGR